MKISLLIISVLTIACNTILKEEPKNTNWIEYSTKDSIPRILLNKLLKETNGKFRLANPDEEYSDTDNISDENLPQRQLNFLARKGNSWMLTYAHGGRGWHSHFIECEIEGDLLKSWKTGITMEDLKTLKQIEEVLKTKQIEFPANHF